ncbi:MAG TPA: hypothetical protein VMI31_11450 [Fimbriimonadaceae bacterium]|nr:hypothetical protein [Fimbriimonadaceae bacterium]
MIALIGISLAGIACLPISVVWAIRARDWRLVPFSALLAVFPAAAYPHLDFDSSYPLYQGWLPGFLVALAILRPLGRWHRPALAAAAAVLAGSFWAYGSASESGRFGWVWLTNSQRRGFVKSENRKLSKIPLPRQITTIAEARAYVRQEAQWTLADHREVRLVKESPWTASLAGLQEFDGYERYSLKIVGGAPRTLQWTKSEEGR